MSIDSVRRADLSRIHIAKKEAGLDDESYREVLRGVTGKSSAAEMSFRERFQVLQALEKLGAKSAAKKPFPGRPVRPVPDKAELIAKIEAQLAEAKRPWGYAHAMARRMFQLDQVQWCDPDQLRRIVAALTYDARRHGR